MQNVSKALIMAGSVILGVILLATLVYVLRMGGSVNKTYDETQLSYQTEGFNYQFEVYQRDDNNILDIVTLLNLAYSVNSENGYDANNSVIITITVGNKTYRIPKDISTDIEVFHDNNYKALERNQIFDTAGSNGGVISIYDLLEKPFNELGISAGIVGLDTKDKLSKIHIGHYVYYPNRKADDPNIGEPIVGNSGTTYKYIFDCNDDTIKYNKTTGKISQMEFVCKVNPYWELGPYYTTIGLPTAPEWD